jgi:hypothetical protein
MTDEASPTAPLATLTNRRAFKDILKSAEVLRDQYASEPNLYPHLNAMVIGMTNLRDAVSLS